MKNTTKKLLPYLYSTPFLILLFAFALCPFILNIGMIFTNYGLMRAEWNFVGLKNYQKFLGDRYFWEALGNTTSVCDAQWPAFNEDYLKEDTVKYTISFNGKARFTMEFATDADNNTIQATVMANEQAQKWIEGKTPKKVIIVPKKIVNIVL